MAESFILQRSLKGSLNGFSRLKINNSLTSIGFDHKIQA